MAVSCKPYLFCSLKRLIKSKAPPPLFLSLSPSPFKQYTLTKRRLGHLLSCAPILWPWPACPPSAFEALPAGSEKRMHDCHTYRELMHSKVRSLGTRKGWLLSIQRGKCTYADK